MILKRAHNSYATPRLEGSAVAAAGKDTPGRMPCKRCTVSQLQAQGHYSAQCRQRTVSTVQNGDVIESAFLDTVLNEEKSVWTSNLTMDGKEVPFKLDTEAEVTAVSKETWQILGKPALQPPNKHLLGPAKQPFAVLGRFSCHLFNKGREVQHQAFVVDYLKTNLHVLGLPAITALHLAVRADVVQITVTAESIRKRFPKVFQGLGTLPGEYHIQLRPNAKPHALFTKGHVLLPLRPRVVEELERMEKAGVIAKVFEPTPWCAGMVVVPNKYGDVRICVDLKPLNQKVL